MRRLKKSISSALVAAGFFLPIVAASGAEADSIKIYYLDPWSTSGLPMSTKDVIEGVEKHHSGTLINLIGRDAFVTVGPILDKYLEVKSLPSQESENKMDVRIVFDFFYKNKEIQLSVDPAGESRWDNNVKVPKEDEQGILQLLPEFFLNYLKNPEAFLKQSNLPGNSGK
jgi:hypothetical protein